jgi:hypothetical protein
MVNTCAAIDVPFYIRQEMKKERKKREAEYIHRGRGMDMN